MLPSGNGSYSDKKKLPQKCPPHFWPPLKIPLNCVLPQKKLCFCSITLLLKKPPEFRTEHQRIAVELAGC